MGKKWSKLKWSSKNCHLLKVRQIIKDSWINPRSSAVFIQKSLVLAILLGNNPETMTRQVFPSAPSHKNTISANYHELAEDMAYPNLPPIIFYPKILRALQQLILGCSCTCFLHWKCTSGLYKLLRAALLSCRVYMFGLSFSRCSSLAPSRSPGCYYHCIWRSWFMDKINVPWRSHVSCVVSSCLCVGLCIFRCLHP